MKRFYLFVQQFSRSLHSSLYVIPIAVLLILFMAASCGTTKRSATEKQKVELVSDKDSTEYELIEIGRAHV